MKSKNTQYDILTSDVKYEASKFTMLRDFYAAHNDGKELTEKALQSMGFYNEDGLLANGALLFADDYQDKKTEIQCSVFSGFNKGSERIITINRFNGNIISAINYIIEFVTQRMNHSMIKLGDTRKNIDAYPQRALFEGVINAVAWMASKIAVFQSLRSCRWQMERIMMIRFWHFAIIRRTRFLRLQSI